ncbi:MAG: RagB/SusD family nutrient uptake outer membrane protein [Bacteroidales bacterium]|jgi:hypothetical protein|nr:RagB/SusD family nutrient uptake outer membrane protein [Bacteroidales bacterium]
MKTLKLIFISFYMFLHVSCDFLDMQPIEPYQTAEDVFEKLSGVQAYLAGIWQWIPAEYLNGPSTDIPTVPWLPISDETDVSFNNDFIKMINGTWTASSSGQYDKWHHCYKGIREANYFMQNVDLCNDPDLTEEYKTAYLAEARFVRAYYYYYLLRMYGPVCLMGDEIIDPNADFNRARSKYEECVQYVCNEFDTVAFKLGIDPLDSRGGKPTRGMALALKSRLLLYAASPLFNNPDNNSIYKDYKNSAGEHLIPVDYSREKWKKAADAALDVINLQDLSGNKKYGLVTASSAMSNIDPYESLNSLYVTPWNKEIIFGRYLNGDHTYYSRCVPRGVGGSAWGGMAPTLQQADAYAMESGLYPVTPVYANGEYSYTIDASTGYNEEGFENFEHPYDKYTQQTPKMFIGREPRFYMDIIWNGMTYFFGIQTPQSPNANNSVKVEYHYNGNSGPGSSHNYSLTGLGLRKWNPRQNNLKTGNFIPDPAWPYVRLGEIYLNYTEAMIEYDCTQLDYSYWDELRERAGLPPILDVYPDAYNNRQKLQDLVRRERRVELSFESARYFDTRRWQIAEQTNAGYMWGFNVMENTGAENSAFWTRTHTGRGKRYFEKKQYLFPVMQNHIDRDNLLEQSPFWR